MSLSYNPSNQGLKHSIDLILAFTIIVFILQSIKPRVETDISPFSSFLLICLYPTIHQTKG
ncbi:MAG: hypothetical protein WCQ59_06985, partial [Candidatus Cloacimonadaceae bacterium]